MPVTDRQLFSHRARHEASVLKHIYSECYKEVDGCWVWSPSYDMFTRGALTQGDVAMIAHILKAANRLWDEQVRKDLT